MRKRTDKEWLEVARSLMNDFSDEADKIMCEAVDETDSYVFDEIYRLRDLRRLLVDVSRKSYPGLLFVRIGEVNGSYYVKTDKVFYFGRMETADDAVAAVRSRFEKASIDEHEVTVVGDDVETPCLVSSAENHWE